MAKIVTLRHRTDDAKDQLTKAYAEKFGKQPTRVGKTIINMAAPRIAKGDKFKWCYMGEMKVEALNFLPPANFKLQGVTTGRTQIDKPNRGNTPK